MTINDGQNHTVYLVTESSPFVITKLYVDGVIRVNSTADILSSGWKSAVVNTNIQVGRVTASSDAGKTYDYYQGCLNGLKIGGRSVDLDTATNSDGVSSGCHRSIDACTPSVTCGNNSTCEEDFNDYKCKCPEFYTGKTCNETINLKCSFKSGLCNNGTCRGLALAVGRSPPTVSQNGKDLFECACSDGYEGSLCETDIDECASQPCKNGTCVDGVNSFVCNCHPGFTGSNCEINIDECAPEPCKNGMRCLDDINKYTCDCQGRYTGTNCDTDVDECLDLDTCTRKGNCTNSPGSFSCACEAGYFGVKCQYNNTQICAIEKPCKNSGTCLSDMSGYNCSCTEQYQGVNCTEEVVADDDHLPLIIGLSVAGALIVLLILIILLVRYCRDKSGMEGTYSPNKEEQAGGNVEMHAVKKPKTERLI